MNCSISNDAIEALRTKVAGDLLDINKKGETLDVKEYIKSVHGMILEATEDEVKALDAARLVPLFMEQLKPFNKDIKTTLKTSNIDSNQLDELVDSFSADESLDVIKSYIGIGVEEFNKEKKELEVLNTAEKTSPTPEAQKKIDDDSKKKSDQVKKSEPEKVNVLQVAAKKVRDKFLEVFSAAAPSFFTTTGLEAYFKSDEFTPTPGTDRVPIPKKIFYYKVQRNLIKLLKAAGDNPLTLGKANDRVYLTPMLVSEVEGASIIYPDADVVLVVTDQFGTPFKFNKVTGEQTEGEKSDIAFYDLKRTKDKFDGELLSKDGTLAKSGKAQSKASSMVASLSAIKDISNAEAQAILEREGKALADIRNYVKDSSKTKPLKFEITGGSLGYIDTDFNKLTPLSKIKEVLTFKKGSQISDNDLGSAKERENKDGKFYVTVDALHGRHIQVEQPGIPDTTNRELILDLLLEQELYEGENLISPKDRLQYVQNYINVISDTSLIKMKVSPEGNSYTLLDANGNLLELSDPKTRAYINDLMSELKPKGEGTKDYYKLKMNINADRIAQNSIKVPSITQNEAGQKTITTTVENYQEFLKKNDFKVTTLEIGDDGKLRKTNSYFAFNLTEESQEDLYGITLEEAPTASITTAPLTEDKKTDIERRRALSLQPFNEKTEEGFIHKHDDGVWTTYIFEPGFTTEEEANKIAKTKGLNARPYDEIEANSEEELKVKINNKYDAELAALEEVATEEEIEIPEPDAEELELPEVLDAPQSDEDLLNELKEGDDTWNKTIDQKNSNRKETEKKIQEAKEWYEKSPLSKHFPFEVFFNKLNEKNKDAVATWSLEGITLFKGADYTDLYHEAWHGFTQGMLTKQQKKDLYKEVSKKEGFFKDYNGKLVTFANANPKQIEEYLAEGFRTYMLNGQKAIKGSPKQSSFFRKIWNVLKVLFGNTTLQSIATDAKADSVVNELYEKLRVGNLKEYSFSVENAAFSNLNSGITSKDGSTQLNYQNSKEVLTMIDNFIVEYTQIRNSKLNPKEYVELQRLEAVDISTLSTQKIDGVSERELHQARLKELRKDKTYEFTSQITNDPAIMLQAYKFAQSRLYKTYYEAYQNYLAETDESKKALLQKDYQMLKLAYEEFGITKETKSIFEGSPTSGEVIKTTMHYHRLKSKLFLDTVGILEGENLSEDEVTAKSLRAFERSGNETSLEGLAADEILYILKTLPKYNKDGTIEQNRFGFNELADFQAVWNRLARTLQNTGTNLDLMLSRLEEAKEEYPAFQDLIDRMGAPSENASAGETDIWSKFIQTFSKPRVPLVQMTVVGVVDKNGDTTYKSTIGEAFNADFVVGRNWQSNFTSTREGENKYVLKDANGESYLNTALILKDFSRNEAFDNPFSFFNAVGFTLTDNKNLRSKLIKGKEIFGPQYFHDALTKLEADNVKVTNFKQITDTLSNRYKSLQILESQNSDIFNNYMVTNAENNTQFEHTLNNTMAIMVTDINNAENYQSLIAQPHMAHLDVNKSPFAESSLWLRSIFHLEKTDTNYGERRKHNGKDVTLKLVNLSGSLVKKNDLDIGEGISSASADEMTKLITDLHLSYAGTPEVMRHADKGTSFSISLDGPFLFSERADENYIDIASFAGNSYQKKTQDLLYPHLIAEMKRMRIMKSLDGNVENYDFNYVKEGQKFATFDKVLRADTKANLEKIAFGTENIEEGIKASDISSLINKDISDYFEEQYQENKPKFDTASFISDNIREDVTNKGVPTNKVREALVKSYVTNTWINNVESLGLFYGDIAQYKHAKEEFHKRNAAVGSTGTIYRTDSIIQKYINNNLHEGSYAESLGFEKSEYTNEIKTAILKDNYVESAYYDQYLKAFMKSGMTEEEAKFNLKDYLKQNEADAQGLITFDAYRRLKVAEGSWTNKHSELYEQVVKGIPVDPAKLTKFFPVIKAQYAGPLKTDHLPVTGFHKYSLFPMIPSVIKDKNMEALHKKMLKENISYVTFQSGSKVGNITKNGEFDTLYSENRNLEPSIHNLEETDADGNYVPYFTPNVIHLQYLKNQLAIHDEAKGKVIFSTQLRKLIEEGLWKSGVPKDYLPNEKNQAKRKTAWANEKNKSQSQFYNLSLEYEKNINKLTQFAKDKLLKELNFTSKMVGGKEVLTGDISNLIVLIKKELTREDLPQHAIDFVNAADGKLKHDLSLSLSVEQIETLLNSLMVKRLIRQKVNGEGLIQVAATLMEDMAQNEGRNFENPTEEDLAKYGTDDLPTYNQLYDEEGNALPTSAMKVKIALQGDFLNLLKVLHTDGEVIGTRERLNEMVKSEEWLNTGRNREMVTMTGVRIPVQGLNSMEFMEVYEFLDASAGSIIVSPSEIVTKSGADFDVDKMTVMMPNIKKDGKLWNYTEEEVDEAYKNYIEFRKKKKSFERIEEDASVDDLMFKIFGETRESLEDEMIEVLIEEGKVESKDEFRKRLLSSKAIENDIIQNIRAILELPENFVPLVTPNSTNIFTEKDVDGNPALRDLNSDFNPLKRSHREADGSVMSATTALEVGYNIHKHQVNNISKEVLGLGAIDNTYNTLFNRIGGFMNPTVGMSTKEYKKMSKLSPEEFKELSTEDQDAFKSYKKQTILLPHNTIKVNGEDAISLSHTEDINDEHSIANIVNQLMNGWVDAAKDAWVFDVQGNKEVAPVLLFMIQAGVPIKDAVYFASSPLVKDYVKRQKAAKSVFGGLLNVAPDNKNYFRKHAREGVLKDSRFGFGVSKIDKFNPVSSIIKKGLKGAKQFDTQTLLDNAKNKSNVYSDSDRQTFLHFLELEDMTKSVRDLKMRTNVDTSKDGTLFEAQDRLKMISGLKADQRLPTSLVSSIQNNTPISSFFIQDFQIELLGRLFPLRNHEVLNKFLNENLTKQNIDNTYGKKEIAASNWKGELVNYIFQNELRHFDINDDYYRSLSISESYPTEGLYLKHGAFVQDGKLYIDKAELKRQYKTQDFSNPEFTKENNLALVSNLTFSNESEFYHFVLERETIRSQEPLGSLLNSSKFKNLIDVVEPKVAQLKGESVADYSRRVVKQAYEEYIKDKALTKIYNNWHLFKGSNTYAQEFKRIRDTHFTKELLEYYPIMTALDPKIKDPKTGVIYKNLALNNTKLTGDQINIFNENLTDLSNVSTLRSIMPEASLEDINDIADFFQNFDKIAFLQSGMNAKSAFALTPLVTQNKIISILEEPLANFSKMLNSKSKIKKYLTNAYLTEFHSSWAMANANRDGRIRGTNYFKNLSLTNLDVLDTTLREYYGESQVVEETKYQDIFARYSYRGMPIFNRTDITSAEGTAGAAQFDRDAGYILINERLLRTKFEEKAWTNPRALMETMHGKQVESYAEAIPEDAFENFIAFEKFVMEHEYQHSIYSRSDFNAEYPNKTKGDYETEINKRAFEAIEKEDSMIETQDGKIPVYDQPISPEDAKTKALAKPDTVFVYNAGIERTPITDSRSGDIGFEGVAPNVLGLTTRNKTLGHPAEVIIKDVDGNIDPKVKDLIDANIEQLKELVASGKTLTFSKKGYGMNMLTKDGSGNMYAPRTFLYLSKKLYENFRYLNPKYLETGTGYNLIQRNQSLSDMEVQNLKEVTDEDVKDFMNHCLI